MQNPHKYNAALGPEVLHLGGCHCIYYIVNIILSMKVSFRLNINISLSTVMLRLDFHQEYPHFASCLYHTLWLQYSTNILA